MTVYPGMKFNRWTLVEWKETRGKNKLWLCRCDCGTEKIVQLGNVRYGKSTSCGCYHAEQLSKARSKHRMSSHPIYRSWAAIKNRCLNENAEDYKWYGGRGIKVCDRWMTFQNFADDMSPSWSRGMTIERIDTNGNYDPSNCRWATMREQSRNTRRTLRVNVNGVECCLKDVAKDIGISYGMALSRYKRGARTTAALLSAA